MTPETRLKTQIIDHLRNMRQDGRAVWWNKIHGSPYSTVGVPDLHVIVEGHEFQVECKAAAGRLSEMQKYQHRLICAAGGEVYVVRSLGEFLEVME